MCALAGRLSRWLAEGAGGGHAMLPAAGRVCSVHCAGANVGPTVRRGNVPWHFRTPSGAGGGFKPVGAVALSVNHAPKLLMHQSSGCYRPVPHRCPLGVVWAVWASP